MTVIVALPLAFLAPTEGRGDPLVNAFLFYPASYTAAQPYSPPAGAEEVWLVTADGVRLHAEFHARPRPRAVILYHHGNAANLRGWGAAAAELSRALDAAVLIYDYRGFGASAGKPTAPGILRDGRAALAWLCARTGVAPAEVVEFGASLGAAVAVDLAAENGARLLVIDSGFASLPAMALAVFPDLPLHRLIAYPLPSEDVIAGYTGPLLVFHGTRDRVVPYTHGLRLFKAAGSKEKQMVTFENQGHLVHDSKTYIEAINAAL